MRPPIVLLATLLLAGAAAAGDAPDTAAAARALAALDRAMPARDLDALGRFLSDEVRITVDSTVRGAIFHGSLDKQRYLAMVADAWRKASDYQYRRIDLEISRRDQTIVATSVTLETLTLDGVVMHTRTRETTTLAPCPAGLCATAIQLESND